MKNKFNLKKTLFSVIFGFVLSLICGFGFLDVKEAKALDSSIDIYDYEWANFFDLDALFLGSNTAYSISKVEDSIVSDYPFLRFRSESEPIAGVLLDSDPFGENGCLRSITNQGTYYFTFRYYTSNGAVPQFRLYFETSTGFLSLGNNSGFSFPIYDVDSLYLGLEDGAVIPAYCVIEYIEIACYFGSHSYDYTPYFYSLESLPDDGGSGDSGSGNSGSDTPDVPDVPDIPDVPEVDGSYQEGYLAGLAQAQYGFLGTNNIFLVITYTDGYVARYKIEPTRIFGGLDFSNVYNDYVLNINDTVSSSRLEFYFSPFVRPSALILYGEGPAYFFNSNMVVNPEVSGNSNPVLNWHVSSDNSTLYETTLVRGENLGDWQAVSLFSANYTSFDFLKGLRLFVTDSNLYENGYLVGSGEGYNKGYYEGLEANQQEIYDKAYDEGHRIGYDDGFVVGSRANNSFLGLFTAVIDAPVLTFTSMLDFDILGYNMKSIVLSLLSIALVVAIIRLFSKGGSAV